MNMRLPGICRLYRAALLTVTASCLVIVPAAAQETESDAAEAFVETFDGAVLPDWSLSEGAFVAEGSLHLEAGAQAELAGRWRDCTILVRLRRFSSGPFTVAHGTAGDDFVQVALDDESIGAWRSRAGVAVDLIVERPVPGPPQVPPGEWFTLNLTQLDTMYVVAVDDVRVCDLFDPAAVAMPSGGLTISASGQNAIEIDEVVIIPWLLEDFDGALSPAWIVPEQTDPASLLHDGMLVVPAGAFAVRTGDWQDMTLSARMERSEQSTVALSYPGHVVMLYPDSIRLLSEMDGEIRELAGAPLPALPPEPQAASWMDLTVIVQESIHTVLAYGMPLIRAEDPTAAGPVAIEPVQGQAVVDRLLIGPPLPLWAFEEMPDGGEPDNEPPDTNEPDNQPPDNEEPGETGPSLPTADLAVTDLFPQQAPIGKLYFRLTNNGPDSLQGAAVTVTCGGTATAVSSAVTSIPAAVQGTFAVTLAPGQTQSFATHIDLDLSNFEYDLSCEAVAASAGFADPDISNNLYSEHIDAVVASLPSADLAVTDLFPEHAPMGKLHLRITNHGPDTLTGAPVTIWCGGQATDLASGAKTSIPASAQGSFNITISPGQTHEFPTQIDLDLNNFKYDISGEVVGDPTAFTDSNPGNNAYTEHIEAAAQAHIVSADLAVTDLFADSLPAGNVYCRITNNGPDAIQNALVGLHTTVIVHTYNPGDPTVSAASYGTETITLQPGQTGLFETGIGVVDSIKYWYEFTCEVSWLSDPDHSNDSYSERIPPAP
jgi:hypothetical protein